MACPKCLVWSGVGYEGERTEDTSSVEYYEHNVDNLAIKVVGQIWSSALISLVLEDWEVGRLASSCHKALDLLCQEIQDSSESLVLAVFGRFSQRGGSVGKCRSDGWLAAAWAAFSKERSVVSELKQ